MDILQKMKSGLVCCDGGTGTLLQRRGLAPGELPELWNLRHPEEIIALHHAYYRAGSNIVCANTFGANRLKFDGRDGRPALREVIAAAMDCLHKAREQAEREIPGTDRYAALDIGPCGRLLKPLGDMDFEEAVSLFSEIASLGAEYGADLLFIETMGDAYETKAALLGAKEASTLPVFVTTAYDASGKLLTGADPCAMVALLEGLGADALGLNCGLGPVEMADIVSALCKYASVPVIAQPNAGLPRSVNGQTVFDVGPDAFAEAMAELVHRGARIVGGCCGTTPEHITAMLHKIRGIEPLPLTEKPYTLVSSRTHAVEIGQKPVIIGERINPTGKARFKQALREHDMDYLLAEGVKQDEAGAHILDVNTGLPGTDEKALLCDAVMALQSVLDLPLQLDTSDPVAMERAMRITCGKPMINSVNGKAESMSAVFPLVKKYGGVVVALTLDENGIPETPEERRAIAENICAEASKYGISRKNIVVDPLCMAVSAAPDSALCTLESVRLIHEKLGVHTSLGVSNVSFGLPDREGLNTAFLTMALGAGLSAAIMNPLSESMMRAYRSFLALSALDPGFEQYIAAVADKAPEPSSPAAPGTLGTDERERLTHAVVKGLRDQAAAATQALLGGLAPTEIIDGALVPALDTVGKSFEKGKTFLPQLLMSAEAAKASFEVIRQHLLRTGGEQVKKGLIVLATVRGDIHDIGKNIVKAMLDNYGFEIVDLGRDVPPETIVDTVVERGATLAGLSALMTTTVPAMEETIRLLRVRAPACRVMVGGAVLTSEYADSIGADAYASDAMSAVRYAEAHFTGNRAV